MYSENMNNDWLDFYVTLSDLSKSIRNKEQNDIELFLIQSIYSTICFAHQNDIDMNSSWKRWLAKVDYKKYY